jgi:hypothetical protein
VGVLRHSDAERVASLFKLIAFAVVTKFVLLWDSTVSMSPLLWETTVTILMGLTETKHVVLCYCLLRDTYNGDCMSAVWDHTD